LIWQKAGILMQTNNRQGLIVNIIAGIMLAFARIYLLVLLVGAAILLAIFSLVRDPRGLLVTIIIVLIIYVFFIQ
jgi:uncharacterized membrane protein YeaQ/YmgE (transglycosylase-associated protein family)